MRLTLFPILTVLLASCYRLPDPPLATSSTRPVAKPALTTSPQPQPSPPPTPAPLAQSPATGASVTSRTISGITFEGVAFDSRTHRLAVVDQPAGPGTNFPDASSAGRARGAIAAINAGFFTPEGQPLGLVMADGVKSGAWNSASSLGSGLWADSPSGGFIARRENIGKSAALTHRELLQAGPMLLENGVPVGGLEPLKSSVRTLLVCDGGSRWWLGRTSACTLAELAAALGSAGPASWKPRHALNLDGGRSSDLWISGTLPGGPLVRRASWNRPVRNFLVLLPR